VGLVQEWRGEACTGGGKDHCPSTGMEGEACTGGGVRPVQEVVRKAVARSAQK
jgi:hypothetical protein